MGPVRVKCASFSSVNTLYKIIIFKSGAGIMKVVSSLKTLKKRDKNCRLVRRKGRIFVINNKNPRFKAKQG